MRITILHLGIAIGALLLSCSSEDEEQRTQFDGRQSAATFKAASSSTFPFKPVKIEITMNPSMAPGNFFVNMEDGGKERRTYVNASGNSEAPELGKVYSMVPQYGPDSRASGSWSNPDVELSASAIENKLVGKNMWQETNNLQLKKAQLRFNKFDTETGALSVDLAFQMTNGKILAGRITGTASMAEGQCGKEPLKKTGFGMEGTPQVCWAQQCDTVMCAAIYREGTGEFEAACEQRGQLIDCGCHKLCSVNVGSFP